MFFWGLAALMLAAAVVMVAWPIFANKGETKAAERDRLNVAIFKDRMAELEQERAEDLLSDEEYGAARKELEKDLLLNTDTAAESEPPRDTGGRWMVPVVAVLLPVLAIGLYLQLGSVDLVDRQAAQSAGQSRDGMPTASDMQAVVAKLKARLEEQPDNVDGWILLARSLVTLQRYGEAAEALERARSVGGDTPALLAEHAEVLAMTRGGAMDGEPMELVKRALGQDPAQPHALWLAGVAELQKDNFAKAIDYWNRLMEIVPEGSEAQQMVQANIERARAEMGDDTPMDTGAAADVAIRVSVSIAPEIAERVAPSDTVFVFARPAGGGMPVAAVRLTAGELPKSIVLDNSSAPPMGGGKLSDYDTVTLVARVSKRGNAVAASGDLQGQKQVPIGNGRGVSLTIDSVVP